MGDNFPATFYLPRTMEHRLGEESVRFDEVCVVADRKSFSLLVEVHQGQRLSLHRPSRLERAAAAQLPGGSIFQRKV